MTPACGHLLCELIGSSSCSITAGRSRGCTPGLASKELAPELLDEVRALVGAIDADARDEPGRAAAVRLAEIIRREAREDRNVLVLVRREDPELATLLAPLCVRRR